MFMDNLTHKNIFNDENIKHEALFIDFVLPILSYIKNFLIIAPLAKSNSY